MRRVEGTEPFEQGASSEEENLNAAVEKVVDLYLGDKIKLLGPAWQEKKDEIIKVWKNAASEYGDFSGRIEKLGEVLVAAYTTESEYPKGIIPVLKLNFDQVEDPMAGELLSYLLLARIIESPGHIDYSKDAAAEAEEMRSELEDNQIGLKKITLDGVFKAVLSGKLKLPEHIG